MVDEITVKQTVCTHTHTHSHRNCTTTRGIFSCDQNKNAEQIHKHLCARKGVSGHKNGAPFTISQYFFFLIDGVSVCDNDDNIQRVNCTGAQDPHPTAVAVIRSALRADHPQTYAHRHPLPTSSSHHTHTHTNHRFSFGSLEPSFLRGVVDVPVDAVVVPPFPNCGGDVMSNIMRLCGVVVGCSLDGGRFRCCSPMGCGTLLRSRVRDGRRHSGKCAAARA